MTPAQMACRSAQVAALDEPIAVVDDVSVAEWDAYVASAPGASRYHLACWRTVFTRAFGHETVYLAARWRGHVIGVLPMVAFDSRAFGRFLVSLPFVNYGGVLADDDDACAALVERARQEAERRKARYVELRHMRRLLPALPEKQHKVAMTRPLPADAQSAWAGLDHKVRNQVRKAEKAGLKAVAGGTELVDEFYAVLSHNMRDLGTPIYDKRFFVEILERVPESRVHLVRLDAAPLAAGITIGYRAAVENPWAGSLRTHRAMCPNMLLYWAMITDAIERGYRVFDFGRSTPNEGTFQFKKQWGAEAAPCHWEYVLNGASRLPDFNPKSAKFARAVAVWQRLPLGIANALGPRVVRNIP
jgi:FemAB-related protein (PEP-CTERM system-associated)